MTLRASRYRAFSCAWAFRPEQGGVNIPVMIDELVVRQRRLTLE